MSDTNANGNAKGWTPDEEYDLVMATLYQSNAFAAVPWEAVAEMLQRKYPTKSKEGCRQKFQKLRNAYLAKFEVGANEVPAGATNAKAKGTPKTPKTPRKRAATAAASEDNEGGETQSVKKPRKKAPAKKQEDEVMDAPEEAPEEEMDV